MIALEDISKKIARDCGQAMSFCFFRDHAVAPSDRRLGVIIGQHIRLSDLDSSLGLG